MQATSTIPIVFFSVGDPVGEGFVAGLSRPGRNATGFINMEASMSRAAQRDCAECHEGRHSVQPGNRSTWRIVLL
jgi:hypothetical protein